MPDLQFQVIRATVAERAVVPTLLFGIRIACRTREIAIDSIALQCQIRIDPARRRYTDSDAPKLDDLFGERRRWGETLKSFLWTHVHASVPAFKSHTEFQLPAPCSYDFNIAATKFFHGIGDGDAPLSFLFRGSVFHYDEAGDLQIEPVPWTSDAPYRLPAKIWHGMMAQYYPDGVWLPVERSTLDKLEQFKRQHRLADWSEAIELLMKERREVVA